MSKISIIQDLNIPNFDKLSQEQNQRLQALKLQRQHENPFITAVNFEHLAMAIQLGFPIVTYHSQNVVDEDQNQYLYGINTVHADRLATILQNANLFHFRLFLSTWIEDSLQTLLNKIKMGSPYIEKLHIHYVTGDEFKANQASVLAELITHCRVRSLLIQNNDLDSDALRMLSQTLMQLKNKTLEEIRIVPHDDEIPTRSYQYQELVNFTNLNLRSTKLKSNYFDWIMQMIKSHHQYGEYFDCAFLAESTLRLYNLDQDQAGWLVDYRHRSWFELGLPKYFNDALTFLEDPKMEFKISDKNYLWILSTSMQMATVLERPETVNKFYESYLKLNAQGNNSHLKAANEIRCSLNAIIMFEQLNKKELALSIKNLTKLKIKDHPEIAQELDLPEWLVS